MYQLTKRTLGSWEIWDITHDSGRSKLSICPERGGLILDIVLDGESILDGYQTAEELDTLEKGKSIVLFPFPNRMRDGKYAFEGNNYHFAINNPETGNALHGFGMNTQMNVLDLQLGKEVAILELGYQDDGSRPEYPFPFAFRFQLKLSPQELEGKFIFENTGTTALPVGLGWHPYFQLSPKVDSVSMQLPECEKIEVDDRMLPTGRRTFYDSYQSLKPIGEDQLDNGFFLTGPSGKAHVLLQGEKGILDYWQSAGHRQFNYLQVFTPPHRQSVAIEPMTCNIDAFNNGDGLIRLGPSDSVEASFGLHFKKADA
jgi:aldose 1-epimerase